MYRIRLTPRRGQRGPTYRYVDSLHAALVAGLRAAGLASGDLVGQGARAWTFAAEGWSKPGGAKLLRAVVVASPDPSFGAALRRLDPATVRVVSANGDRFDFCGAVVEPEADPIGPAQGAIYVRPLSPFVIGRRKDERGKGRFVEDIAEADLSAALSAGLSRRLDREVRLRVRADRLALAGRAGRAIPVRVRSARPRDIFVPGFDVPVVLEGSDDDLRAAWYAGLGEKCRYGFGCLALPHAGLA